MPGIADVNRAETSESLRRTTGAGGHDTVKHINTAQDSADNIVRTAYPHQVAGFIVRQHSRSIIQHFEHGFLPFTDSQAADSITVKADFFQAFGGKAAQVFIIAALLNAENPVAVTVGEGIAAASGPAHGHFH